jgi:hypothetical protein
MLQGYSLCSEVHTEHITEVYGQTLKLFKLGCACSNHRAPEGDQCLVPTAYWATKPE